MTKLLAYILSVYVVGLTLLPCVDLPENAHVYHQKLSTQNTGSTHQDATDVCSPFCSCNCCSSPLVYVATGTDMDVVSTPSTTIADYKSAQTQHLYSSIWQPPKIG